jgi:hypothetical protein
MFSIIKIDCFTKQSVPDEEKSCEYPGPSKKRHWGVWENTGILMGLFLSEDTIYELKETSVSLRKHVISWK